MLNLTIQGKIPVINFDEITVAYERIAKYLETSIRRNFAEAGRPERWTPKKTGEQSYLYKTGALFNSVYSSFGENFAEAGAGVNLDYAWVHQKGTELIPQREYILFQEDDVAYINEIFQEQIIKFFNSDGETL